MAGKVQVTAADHIAYLIKKPKQIESRASGLDPSSFCEATPTKGFTAFPNSISIQSSSDTIRYYQR